MNLWGLFGDEEGRRLAVFTARWTLVLGKRVIRSTSCLVLG